MGLFDFFKTKDKRLDALVSEIENDMANNYKDAAQTAFKELCQEFNELAEQDKLNRNQKNYYSSLIEGFKHSLAGYTHKDQKPYWSHN